MTSKKILTAIAASALVVAPTMATAQTAGSAALLSVQPASETVEGSELRGGLLLPAIAIIAIILGILAVTGGDDDGPNSP